MKPFVILPCYEWTVAHQATDSVRGRTIASRLIEVMNVNSGPHFMPDDDYALEIKAARRFGVKIAFYVDLVAGRKYSPVLQGVGDSYKITTPSKERNKTTDELNRETRAWAEFYGMPDFWFFDDWRKGQSPHLMTTHGIPVILNPGTAMAPPVGMTNSKIIIHEDETGWPRKLTTWEKVNKARCAVMGLGVRPRLLKDFLASTADMWARYASPLADDEGCYDNLPPYFLDLFK